MTALAVIGIATPLLDHRVEATLFQFLFSIPSVVDFSNNVFASTGESVFGDIQQVWEQYRAVLAAFLVRKPGAGTIAMTINGFGQVFLNGTHPPHFYTGDRRSGRDDQVNPMYIADSGIHGKGAFASRPFRMGEVVCKIEGVECHYTEMTPEELALSFESKPDHYILPDTPVRYMNHSDSPNCRVGGLTIRAGRDISQGEELTIDYRETTTWRDYRLPWS